MISVKASAASITSVILEVPDPDAAGAFYRAAFGLGSQLRLRASQAPATGFRGFTMSLVVSQPATVDALIGAALDAGATALKPAKKGFWGYGGVVSAPDGTTWKVATSAKKDTGRPPGRSTTSCSCWEPRTLPPASSSTSSGASW